jgi:hypothetical protein
MSVPINPLDWPQAAMPYLDQAFHAMDTFGQQHWGFILTFMVSYYVLRNFVNGLRANIAKARSLRLNHWDLEFMKGSPYVNPGMQPRDNSRFGSLASKPGRIDLDNMSDFERAKHTGDYSQVPESERPLSNLND